MGVKRIFEDGSDVFSVDEGGYLRVVDVEVGAPHNTRPLVGPSQLREFADWLLSEVETAENNAAESANRKPSDA